MKNITATLFLMAVLLNSKSGHALNLFELEVYPYQTASKGEFELEHSATIANGTEKSFGASLITSTIELNYGVTDWLEVAGYIDLIPHGDDQAFAYHGFRLRGRSRFLEKGLLPFDLGAYAEISIPRPSLDEVEVELRGIIEKDFGRFTLDLNPILEKKLTGESVSEVELNFATALVYRVSSHFQPRIDFFGEPEGNIYLLSPGATYRLSRTFAMSAGVGFGLTSETEQRLISTRLEYEF